MSTASRAIAASTSVAGGIGRALLALLVVAYVLAAGGLAAWVTGRLLGDDGSPGPVGLGVAALVVVTGIVPVTRWLHRAVEDLLATPTTIDAVRFASVGGRAEATPDEVVDALAATVRDVLAAATVEIVVQPAPSSHATRSGWHRGAHGGRPGTGSEPVTIALHAGDAAIGAVRVWPKRRRALSPAARRTLTDLVRHVELVIGTGLMRDELAASRAALIVAREEERRRLRRDLHDGLGPTLAAMKLQLAALRRELDHDAPPQPGIDTLRSMIDEATDEVRRVVDDLRPPLLDDCGLVDALRNLRFVPPDLRLVVDAPAPLPPLPAAVEVALYRIAAEAVRNTVRHAGATTCAIELQVDAVETRLLVTDDGVGMAGGRTGGVGMTAIAERARELGGRVHVGAGPLGGTVVSASLPLRTETSP